MTRKEQVKILDDKIKANERQYDLDKINAEISAYSSGDLPKYESLTKKNLGYKPDALEKVKFEYSPIGKIFTDVLAKEDKSKKVGLFKRLKNIEDNLVEVDDNDNKVGIFRIIKDIKDRGIKIDNDDEAVREIRACIKKSIDDGVKVNNFYEMKEEIMDHIQNLKDQGINVRIEEDQINDLIKRILDKREKIDKEKTVFIDFSDKYDYNIKINYKKTKISTENMNKAMNNYIRHNNLKDRIDKYNSFSNDINNFTNDMRLKKISSPGDNQKMMYDYWKRLKNNIESLNSEGKGLKILINQQMLNRLSILLAQIQAGNNSIKLKNELRQILYLLYRSKALTKAVYNNLIKVI